MTDAQILAIAITVLVVLAGTMLNNSRIGDVKEVVRAEIKNVALQLENGMTVRFNAMEAADTARFNSIERKLDELIRIGADHDSRITKLEDRPH
jgi:ribosomal protein L16/L10AE